MTKRMTWPVLALALAISTIASACGDGSSTPPTDAGPSSDSGTTNVDGSVPPDSGTPPRDGGGGGTSDGNDSFAQAEEITVDGSADADLETDRDSDYFVFEGTAGQWILILTRSLIDEMPEATDVIDTVLTLYDASMNQIAENDDALPRVNTDSAIWTRLPATGRYYVRVQDYNAWNPSAPPVPRRLTQYQVGVLAVDLAAITSDAEPNDDAAGAQPLALQETLERELTTLVAGSVDAAGDVDVYSFTVRFPSPVQFFLQPPGPTGSGSTATMPSLRIARATTPGSTFARIAPVGLDALSPLLPEGDYLLFVDGPAVTGANDFYFLSAIVEARNPFPSEAMETPNDDVATPEALALQVVGTVRVGGVLAALGPGDVDHFSFEVPAGQVVDASCRARSSGSGVEGLAIQLLTAEGTPVGSPGTETATAAAGLADVPVSAAGTYVLRVSASGQDPQVESNFVRCVVNVAPPG